MSIQPYTITSVTTIFTPPTSCSTSFTLVTAKTTEILMQNALPTMFDTKCFPPGFTAFGKESIGPVYSPGECPLGYSTALESTQDGIITATCCQSGFEFTTKEFDIDRTFHICTSTYTGGPTFFPSVLDRDIIDTSSATVTSGIHMWGKPISVAQGVLSSSAVTRGTPVFLPEPAITIGSTSTNKKTTQSPTPIPPTTPEISFTSASKNTIQSSTLTPSFSHNSSSLNTTGTSTSEALQATTTSLPSTSHRFSHHSSLSKSAITGIVISVIILALIAFGTIALTIRKRKQTKLKNQSHTAKENRSIKARSLWSTWQKAELPAGDDGEVRWHAKAELPTGREAWELHGDSISAAL